MGLALWVSRCQLCVMRLGRTSTEPFWGRRSPHCYSSTSDAITFLRKPMSALRTSNGPALQRVEVCDRQQAVSASSHELAFELHVGLDRHFEEARGLLLTDGAAALDDGVNDRFSRADQLALELTVTAPGKAISRPPDVERQRERYPPRPEPPKVLHEANMIAESEDPTTFPLAPYPSWTAGKNCRGPFQARNAQRTTRNSQRVPKALLQTEHDRPLAYGALFSHRTPAKSSTSPLDTNIGNRLLSSTLGRRNDSRCDNTTMPGYKSR